MKSNFIIVGTQRTGSSSIAETVGLHPEIACGWEWTLRVPRHRKIAVAKAALSGNFDVLNDAHREHIGAEYNEACKWLGYRNLFRSSDKWIFRPAFSVPLWLDGFSPFLRWVEKDSSIHVIHVVRNDNLAWIRSKYLARETGAFVGKKYPKHLKVRVNTTSAVRRVQAKKWLDIRLAQLATTNPYLCVEYESYARNASDVVRCVWDFLGCENAEVDFSRKRLRKQSTVPPEEQISNYEELKNTLNACGTGGLQS